MSDLDAVLEGREALEREFKEYLARHRAQPNMQPTEQAEALIELCFRCADDMRQVAERLQDVLGPSKAPETSPIKRGENLPDLLRRLREAERLLGAYLDVKL